MNKVIDNINMIIHTVAFHRIIFIPSRLKEDLQLLQLYRNIIAKKELQYVTLSIEGLYEVREHLKKAIKLYSELIKTLKECFS